MPTKIAAPRQDFGYRGVYGDLRARRAAPGVPEVRGGQAAPHPDRWREPVGHDERPEAFVIGPHGRPVIDEANVASSPR